MSEEVIASHLSVIVIARLIQPRKECARFVLFAFALNKEPLITDSACSALGARRRRGAKKNGLLRSE